MTACWGRCGDDTACCHSLQITHRTIGLSGEDADTDANKSSIVKLASTKQ